MDIGNFLGAIISGTGLGIGRSGMHAPSPEQQGADILREASAAGVSPLAILGAGGYNAGGGFGANVGDASTAGQLLARSSQAASSSSTKLDALREQNLALQNAQLEAEITAQQIRNSHAVTQFGAAGSPPTYNAGNPGSPFFGPVNPFGGPHPDLIRTASGDTMRSKEQAEIAFSGDPWAMAKQFFASMGRDIDSIGPRMPTWSPMLRDDVARYLLNVGSSLGQ